MSDNVIFYKLDAVGRTKAQIQAKIAQLDVLIDALLVTALPSVNNSNIFQYKLDTGQTKTDIIYRSAGDVMNDLKKYEHMRIYYLNMLTPRQVKLVDSRNFKRR